MRRRVLIPVSLLLLVGGLVWHYQGKIIGTGARWYLQRVAARERARGDLSHRRSVVAGMNRLLLLSPPPDGMVPELFDFVTLLSARLAAGEVSLAWGVYLYTSYVRDMVRDRPTGLPARSIAQVGDELTRQLAFFYIQKRPTEAGVRLSDLLGVGGDSYSLEEIQQAEREGRDLPLK